MSQPKAFADGSSLIRSSVSNPWKIAVGPLPTGPSVLPIRLFLTCPARPARPDLWFSPCLPCFQDTQKNGVLTRETSEGGARNVHFVLDFHGRFVFVEKELP
jgi:hypothetical protein